MIENPIILMEGDNNNETAIRNALTNTESPPPYGGTIVVPNVGGASSCWIDVLDLSQTNPGNAQLNVNVRGESDLSKVNIKSGGYILAVNSVVQFRNCDFIGAAGAKAGVVLCRQQVTDAGGMNRCEFINCHFSGTFDVAAIVAYGAEQLVIRDCHFENAFSGTASSSVVSLDSADLEKFTYRSARLTANYVGHTNSGIYIEDSFLFHNGHLEGPWTAAAALSVGAFRRPVLDVPSTGFRYEVTTAGTTGSTEPKWSLSVGDTTPDGSVTWTTRARSAIALKVGDTTTDLIVRGAWLGAGNGLATVQMNGYGTNYGRARRPSRVLFDRITVEQFPPPSYNFQSTNMETVFPAIAEF